MTGKTIIQSAILFFILPLGALGQKAVISEYYNVSGDPTNEWTELLITQDNVTLVGHSLRDNAGSGGEPNNWQGGVKFKDVRLWRNLRAGTIILIKHRGSSVVDEDKSDGYIEINAGNLTYFEKVCWGCALADWENSALNIAQASEIVQLMDPSENHVHSLSHIPNLNRQGDYSDLPSPKVSFHGDVNNGASVRVVPGLSLSAYASGIDNTQTTSSSSDKTEGLPNNSSSSTDENQILWRSLRQPGWTSPNLSISIQGNSLKLNWNTAQDNNPQDGTQGYTIVRYPKDGFIDAEHPVDGKIYSPGDKIGSVTEVVDNIPSSRTAEYTDSFEVPCGDAYIYRVYAFRYSGDDRGMDNCPENARGRSYNETNYAEAEIAKEAPQKPVIIPENGITEICEGDSIELRSNIFTGIEHFEWLLNGNEIPDSDKSRIFAVEAGAYKLRVYDKNGCHSESETVTINVYKYPEADIYYRISAGASYKITNDTNFRICPDEELELLTIQEADILWYLSGTQAGNGKLIRANGQGEYYNVAVNGNLCRDTSYKVNVEFINGDFDIEPDTLFFNLSGSENGAEQSFDLINRNSAELNFSEVDIEQGGVFVLTVPQPPYSIQGNSRKTITAGFYPNSSGSYIDSIVFNGPCGIRKVLYMIGSKESSELSPDLSFIDFGDIFTCDTIGIDTTVTLKNSGTEPAAVLEPLIHNADPMEILSPEFPHGILAGGELKIRIKFSSPAEIINYDAELKIPYITGNVNDTIKIRITGSVYEPKFEILPDTLDFGTLLGCEERKDSTFTIVNNGSTVIEPALKISHSYIETEEIPSEIVPGDSLNIKISFSPTGEGSFELPIIFSAEPCGLIDTLYVRGAKEGIVFSVDSSEIDFGENIDCGDADFIKRKFTIDVSGNTQESPSIKSVRFKNNTGDFSVDLYQNMPLEFGENIIEIRMLYAGIKDYDDILEIIFSPCNIIKEIPLKGSWKTPVYSFEKTIVDFGKGEVTYSADRSITIENSGDIDIVLEEITGLTAPFSFSGLPPQFPDTIPAGESLEYIFNYLRDTEADDTLTVSFIIAEPCKRIHTVTFTGSAYGSGITEELTLRIPDMTALAGEKFTLPVFAENTGWDITSARISKVNLILDYNPDILYPENVTAGSAFQNALSTQPQFSESPPGKLNLNLNIDNPSLLKTGEMLNIEFLALLGSSLKSDVKIAGSNFSADFDIKVIPENGSVSLTGNCQIGDRLISINEPLLLKINGNNTIRNTAEFSFTVVSKDLTTFQIYNNLGRVHTVLIKERMPPGRYTVHFNTANISPGVYHAVLKNGIGTKIVKFMIVR